MTSRLRRSQALLLVLSAMVGIGGSYLASAAASSLSQLEGDVAALAEQRDTVRDKLATTRDSLRQTRSRLDDARTRADELRRQIERRLVMLYTQGHSSASTAALLNAVDGEGPFSDVAHLVRQLGQHEQGQIQEWADLRASIARLEAEERKLTTQAGDLADELRELRGKLRAAERRLATERRRAAAAARAAARQAQELSATPSAAPLPRPIMPQEVALEIAEHAAEDAGEPAPSVSQTTAPAGYVETGEASWYGENFAGQTTASGEVFDPGAMTAAHPHLPMGTLVSVTGPGGATVIVRINDVGPKVAGRIIDLSEAAAQAIGITGVGQVTVKVVN